MMWRWQDCLDDNGWLDVASAIVPANGRHFFDIVVFNPDLYCSLMRPGAI